MCGYGFDDDGQNSKEARESGNELAKDVEASGAVLLKNNHKVLPLANKK